MFTTRLNCSTMLLVLLFVAQQPAVSWGEETKPAGREPLPRARLDRQGDPLPAGALARAGTLRFRHGDGVTSIAYSPDGKTLLSGGLDGTLRLWDSATTKGIREFSESSEAIHQSGFSPDGKTVAALMEQGDIRLLETATGKQIDRLEAPRGSYGSFAFSPDGTTLAVGSRTSGIIWLLDWTTGKELHRLEGHTGAIPTVTFSPDGKLLATAGHDDIVRLWDPATGKELRQRRAPVKLTGFRSVPIGLAFSPDGKLLAVGSSDNAIRLWDPATAREVGRLAAHNHVVASLSFSPDGKLLASGSYDKSIRLWDPGTGKVVHQLAGHPEAVTTVAFSPEGKTLASGAHDHRIRLWDPATGNEIGQIGSGSNEIWSVALSPNGTILATVDRQSTVHLWEATTGKSLGQLQDHRGWGWNVLYSPDGKTVAVIAGQSIHLWDPLTGKERHQLAPRLGIWQHSIRAMAFSADGQKLFSASDDHKLREWDVASGKETNEFPTFGEGLTYAISPDAKLLACTPQNEIAIILWDVVAGKVLRRLALPSFKTQSLAFSPDGRLLAFAGSGSAIHLMDVATGTQLHQFGNERTPSGQARSIYCVRFSPDGRTLASAENDTAVHLWDVASGQKRLSLQGHRASVRTLAFSADGTTLVSGSSDTTALIWDLTGKRLGARPRPSEKELLGLWEDLCGKDATRAYWAIQSLSASGAVAVPFLQERLRPVGMLPGKQVDGLIADLDHDEFETRERATRELEELGESVESALRQALLEHSSAEVRQRAGLILRKLELAGSSERLRVSRAVEALERMGTREARRLLEKLADGAPAARLTEEAKRALKRLPHAALDR